MPMAGRFIIILLIFGVAAHLFLSGDLSFISDYHIWRPIVESNRQEIIPVNDINSSNDQNFMKILSDERKSNLTNITRIDNSINISSKFYNPSANGLLSGELTNVYSTIENSLATGSINKPTKTFTKNVNFSIIDRNIHNTVLNISAGAQSSRRLFGNRTLLKCKITPDLQMVRQNFSLANCSATPPGLVGPIKVWYDEPSFEEIERLNSNLEPGGHGKPNSCQSRHRVAIVVPYRDREAHLRILLHNLHSLLTKQQLDYAIFVVEQHENETFNRAKLMNVGYVEAMKVYDWQCFVFHDVDLLAEDDRNIYSCPDQPRHMSVAVNKFQYKLPYGSIFGGVCAIKTEQFVKINGFSNSYWGWGGEDDDLSMRVTSVGYKIMRYPLEIARYQMITHKSEAKNPINKCRYDLLAKTTLRQQTDGISSLKYECYDLRFLPLFTHIKVKLLEQESKMQLREEGFTKC
ncbi:N-terminal region of glycosyl transferase group 7 family protein [Acanthocheilonema viteae]